MLNFIISLFVFSSICPVSIFAQTSKPTIKETKAWLIEKFNRYGNAVPDKWEKSCLTWNHSQTLFAEEDNYLLMTYVSNTTYRDDVEIDGQNHVFFRIEKYRTTCKVLFSDIDTIFFLPMTDSQTIAFVWSRQAKVQRLTTEYRTKVNDDSWKDQEPLAINDFGIAFYINLHAEDNFQARLEKAIAALMNYNKLSKPKEAY